MQPPFFCDYGSNIELGERVFFNFNCVVLDVCRVRIGDYTLFGPAVQIYTPMHPLNAELRRREEFGKPIDIGSDVWVGGGAIILPGVRSDRAPSSAPVASSHAMFPKASLPPAIRAGSFVRSSSESLVALHQLRVLVLAQAHELRMPQVIVGCPFEELELTDEHRLQPLAFRHLRFRQALSPSTALRLRQVRERALVDLEAR